MRKAMLSLLAMCLAPLVHAQGTFQISSGPYPSGQLAIRASVFQLTAATDIRIRQLEIAHVVAGNYTADVWYRRGALGTVAPSPPPMYGWLQAGTGSGIADSANELYPLPFSVEIEVSANETIAIAVVNRTSWIRDTMWSNTMSPISNAHLSLNVQGYGGAYSALNSPPFTVYYGASRSFVGNVLYDAGPCLQASTPTLNLGNVPVGTMGQTVNYSVSGTLLTGGTQIVAPAGVEISLNEHTGFATSLQLSGHPNLPQTTIYARVMSNAPVGVISSAITHSSPGAPNMRVDLQGRVVSMNASVSAMNLGVEVQNEPSTPWQFTLSGNSLPGPTVITAPQGVEVALSTHGAWAPQTEITQVNFQATIYVRLTTTDVRVVNGFLLAASGPAQVVVTITGEVVPPDHLHVNRAGPVVTSFVDNDQPGVLLMSFGLTCYRTGWDVSAITFRATGNMNADTAFRSLRLVESNAPGPYIPAATLPAAPAGVSFSGGLWTAQLTNQLAPAWTTRYLHLVADLAGTATNGTSLRVGVDSVAATSAAQGAIALGDAGPGTTPVLQINEGMLRATLHGPMAFTTVFNNSQGAGGHGHVICDVTIAPRNDHWIVGAMTFTETGTMNAATAISHLALYEDDGNGVWDGPGVDVMASLTTGSFSGPNGSWSPALTPASKNFGVNQARRYFLVAKLSGTATAGQTLRVSLTGMIHATLLGGDLLGVPSPASSALVVDLTVLTVSAGPQNPQVINRFSTGESMEELIGQFRLTSSSGTFNVSGLTLTTEGDWQNRLDSLFGVQMFRDNGDGKFTFDDIRVFTGGGQNGSMNVQFYAPITIPVNGHVDLWLLVRTTPDAGANPADEFSARIVASQDVQLVGSEASRVVGTVPPESGMLRVIAFEVTSFLPSTTLRNGGEDIVIRGSGFALPVTLTIGGVVCAGDAVVNPEGTEITGLVVPSGTGENLPIVLTTNGLEARTLSQTFSYSGNVGELSKDEPGCVAAAPAAPLVMLFPALLGLVALRRRRK